MTDPLELIREAHYRSSGKELTGSNPYSGFCPAHHDRKRSLSVVDAGGYIGVTCHAATGCDTESVLAVWELEMSDLYVRVKTGLDGKSELASISKGQGNHTKREKRPQRVEDSLPNTDRSSRDNSLNARAPVTISLPGQSPVTVHFGPPQPRHTPPEAPKRDDYVWLRDIVNTWARALPDSLWKDGWLLIVEEWLSLIAVFNDRHKSDLWYPENVIFAGAEAAVLKIGSYDPDLGTKLVTYTKPTIRAAMRTDAHRQREHEAKRLTGGLLEEAGVGRRQDAESTVVSLVRDELPPDYGCLLCGAEIVGGPEDQRFCKDAHRKRYHYLLGKEGAEDEAEAMVKYVAKLDPFSLDAKRDRRALVKAARLIDQQRFRIKKLERILTSAPAKAWVLEALRVNTGLGARALMRSQFEEGLRRGGDEADGNVASGFDHGVVTKGESYTEGDNESYIDRDIFRKGRQQ